MATTVFNYDGSVRTVIADSSLDVTTDLQLPGLNYQSYGSSICSDLIMLLENFSSNDAPEKPVIGQLWFRPMYKDSSGNSYEYNRILVYTGQTASDSLNPKDPNNIVPTGWVDIGTKIYTNISGPITKEIGDIWIYDQKQLYWNGSNWAQLGGAIISQTAPTYIDGVSAPLDGTTWFMIPEGLLWIYDSHLTSPDPKFYRTGGAELSGSWKLIGPSSPSGVNTGSYWIEVPDVNGTLHNVFVNQVDGKIVSVNSSTGFVMDKTSPRALPNFSTYSNVEKPDSVNEIHKGININQYYGFTINGTVSNALFLNGLAQTDFLGRGFNSFGIESPTTPYVDVTTDLGSTKLRWNGVYSDKFIGNGYSTSTSINTLGFPWISNTQTDFIGIALGAEYAIRSHVSDTSDAWVDNTTIGIEGDISANQIIVNADKTLTFTTSITDAGYNNISTKLLPNGKYVLHVEYDQEVGNLQSQIDAIDVSIGKSGVSGNTVYGSILTIEEEIGNKTDTTDDSIYGVLHDHFTHLTNLDNEIVAQQRQINAIEPGRLLTIPPAVYGTPGSYYFTYPAGTRVLRVYGCGAGGAGGSAFKGADNEGSCGVGGSAGAAAEFWVDISKATSQQGVLVVVGSPGQPTLSAPGQNNDSEIWPKGQGGKGGNSVFGDMVHLEGGGGGACLKPSSTGMELIAGNGGGVFEVTNSSPLTISWIKFGKGAEYAFVWNGSDWPSQGADSPFGSGGYLSDLTAGNGQTGHGAGGSGAGANAHSNGDQLGSPGTPGLWVIEAWS